MIMGINYFFSELGDIPVRVVIGQVTFKCVIAVKLLSRSRRFILILKKNSSNASVNHKKLELIHSSTRFFALGSYSEKAYSEFGDSVLAVKLVAGHNFFIEILFY